MEECSRRPSTGDDDHGMPFSSSELKELFHLDSNTGILIRKFNPLKSKRFNTKYSGKEVGYKRPDGYVRVSIDSKGYMRHRIVFLMENGFLPKYIDHINGIPGDDRALNLRGCTMSENMVNSKVQKSNTSGVPGVSFHKTAEKWQARISINNKRINLGLFADKDEAIAVRKKHETIYHGNFSRQH